MNNGSLPTAFTPRPTDNVEVLSRKALSQGEVVLGAPQGETPDAGFMRKVPMDSDEGGRSKPGPQPDTAPEPPVVLDSGRQPPIKGGELSVPTTSAHPEASDNLVEALPLMKDTVLL